MQTKKSSEAYTEQVHILMPGQINGKGRLFGGQLLRWIDEVAGVVARRYSGCDVTTAAIDDLQFLGPAHLNDILVIAAHVTWTGRSSMEVQVDTFVERPEGKRKIVNKAFIVMVALDERENPCEVPALLIETDEERAEWSMADRRQSERKRRRAEYSK